MLNHSIVRRSFVWAMIGLFVTGCGTNADVRTSRVYVGTYTASDKSRGIYTFTFDSESGVASEPQLAAEATNPSFLAVHPSGQYLYAVGEIGRFQGRSSGSVSAYAVEARTGKLSPLNSQPSGGGGPCHVAVHPMGGHVLVANYGGGSISALPVLEGGGLGPATGFVQHVGSSVNKPRQEGPHAHWVGFSPDASLALTADLGLDRILLYRLDQASGRLDPHNPASASVPAGGGPRHFAFHPARPWAYTNNELTSSVTRFKWDSRAGVLDPVQTISTLPHEVQGNTTAQIVVHPNGRFLYVSNRGHNSIVVFSIEPRSGQLTAVGHVPTLGKTPRNFNLDPTGRWMVVANQDSDTVVIFRVDEKTGLADPTGQQLKVGMPVCIEFVVME